MLGVERHHHLRPGENGGASNRHRNKLKSVCQRSSHLGIEEAARREISKRARYRLHRLRGVGGMASMARQAKYMPLS